MQTSDIKEYWRWKIVRQVSVFINDPQEINKVLLEEMVETYAKVHRESRLMPGSAPTEPAAAEFVCTVDC